MDELIARLQSIREHSLALAVSLRDAQRGAADLHRADVLAAIAEIEGDLRAAKEYASAIEEG